MRLHDKAFKISQRKIENLGKIFKSPIHTYVLKTKISFPQLNKQAPSVKLLVISLFFIMPVSFGYVYII